MPSRHAAGIHPALERTAFIIANASRDAKHLNCPFAKNFAKLNPSGFEGLPGPHGPPPAPLSFDGTGGDKRFSFRVVGRRIQHCFRRWLWPGRSHWKRSLQGDFVCRNTQVAGACAEGLSGAPSSRRIICSIYPQARREAVAGDVFRVSGLRHTLIQIKDVTQKKSKTKK